MRFPTHLGTRGRFICLEGGEGVGKTTMLPLLQATLYAQLNVPVEIVADPGTTPLGLALRKIVIDKDMPCDPESLALLYIIARRSLAEYVKSKLDQGTWVLSGRWSVSTWIYQGLNGAVGYSRAKAWCNELVSVDPDLYCILDVNPQVALDRKKAADPAGVAADRYDSRGMDWHKKQRDTYLMIAGEFKFPIIDTSVDVPQVLDQLLDRINTKFGLQLLSNPHS